MCYLLRQNTISFKLSGATINDAHDSIKSILSLIYYLSIEDLLIVNGTCWIFHNMFNSNEIVNRIFELFDGVTQKKLAEMLAISPTLISRWKHRAANDEGAPTLKTLHKIVEMKGVTWDWLLTGKGEVYQIDVKKPPDGTLDAGIDAQLLELIHAHHGLVELLNKIQISALKKELNASAYAEMLMAVFTAVRDDAKRLNIDFDTYNSNGDSQKIS